MALLSGGCNKPESSSGKLFIDLSDNTERSDNLSPEIEKIEFFQISDDIPIDKIMNPQLAHDRIIFHHKGGNYSSQSLGIVAIDLEGNFLWNYDKKGKGPGEFEYISYFTYLPFSDQIIVNDDRLKRLNYLNLDGSFIRSTKFENKGNSAAELPNGNLVINMDIKRQGYGSTLDLQHDLIFLEENLQTIQSFLPHRHNGIGFFWFGETLLRGEKQLLYTNSLQYTIFNITPEGVDSTWKLDFGAYNADTARYLHPQSHDESMMDAEVDEVVAFRLVHSAKNLWVFVPLGQKKHKLAVINKKTRNITYYQKPEEGHFLYNGIPVPMFYLTQNGNKLVYSISALDAIENWDKLSDEQQVASDQDWKKLMENLDPESNPIICVLQPK